jgi:hypothetical protein
MNLRLFQELMELNLAFEQVIQGLQRMEKVKLYHSDIVRYARADVESARVDANREFFDNFDEIVEDDAVWAYKFQREYNKKIKDPDDIYLEIRNAEERRKKKGLPPRLVILPGWDMSDEERYDEEQTKKRKRVGNKRQKTTKKRKPSKPSRRATDRPQTDATLTRKGGDRWRKVKHWRRKRHVYALLEGGIRASGAKLWITSAIPSTTERFASMFLSRTRPCSRSASPVTCPSSAPTSAIGRPGTTK